MRLILSGKPGRGDTWLPKIFDAWGDVLEGDESEKIPRGAYQLRVIRPAVLSEPGGSPPAPQRITPSVDQVPLLATPNVGPEAITSIVTLRLVELIAEGRGAPAEVRPVVWDEQQPIMREHVPGSLMGNMVHYALSHGFFTGIPADALRDLLRNYAQEAGLRGETQHKAVRQASRMLAMLREHPIYEKIRADAA